MFTFLMKWRGPFFNTGKPLCMCLCVFVCVFVWVCVCVCVCVWCGGRRLAPEGEWHMVYSLAPVTHIGTQTPHKQTKHMNTTQYSIRWNISMSSLTITTRDWLCVWGLFFLFFFLILIVFLLELFFCVAITCNIVIFPFFVYLGTCSSLSWGK